MQRLRFEKLNLTVQMKPKDPLTRAGGKRCQRSSPEDRGGMDGAEKVELGEREWGKWEGQRWTWSSPLY